MKWIKHVTVLTVSLWAAGALADKSALQAGKTYYISSETVNLRTEPNLTGQVLGQLKENDQVKVTDLLDKSTPLVKVVVVKSDLKVTAPDTFVSGDYLSSTPASMASSDSGSPSKYFVVQNVATERARVYERCTSSPNCPHRLVFQTEMVVGRTSGGTSPTSFLTHLGHFKIQEWKKFYQDNEEHYPSWYYPTYPAMPFDAGPTDWIGTRYCPKDDKNAHMRGAFGWYTALLGPDANSQWMHGTFGWGHDGNKYIKYTRKTIVNYFSDPRSSGCTRLENQAIAYLRHILPVGTEVFRVYALEGYRDPSLARYESQKNPITFNWILTKLGAQQNGPEADRDVVMSSGVSQDQILESGTFLANQYPKAYPMNPNAGNYRRFRAQSGNTYNIEPSAFKGGFLVDEGRFIGYQHPQDKSIFIGGYTDHGIPAYLQTSGQFNPLALAKDDLAQFAD